MRKRMKRIVSVLLLPVLSLFLCLISPAEGVLAGSGLEEILAEHEVMALLYLEDTYPLRQTASYDGETLAELTSGQTVLIRDIVPGGSGEIWAEVETYAGSSLVSGYVPRNRLISSDEDFLKWEEEDPLHIVQGTVYYAPEDGEQGYEDVESFPESYREALYQLKREHPQWTFVRMDVGLDWKTVLQNELKNNRSLIYKTFPSYMRGDCYDDGNWYQATEGALAYYMDPRNGLTEEAVFQFELLTYNETYHTQEAVDAFLNNTFMRSDQNAPGTEMTFSLIFWAIGREQNTSPFHLAARVYQEQQNGDSPLISGTYPGYEGYYNYFNIKASGNSTEEVIRNGLEHARKNEWTSAYSSIEGGAKVISENYIQKGQDTVYLQKFDVNKNSGHALYTHQYMQNIAAPTSEGKKVKSMYESAGSLDNTFVFKIPVYDNMPAQACPVPGEPVTGWLEEGGYKYWYQNGVKRGTEGRGEEVYDPDSGAWYWLDAENDGRMVVDCDVYIESYAGDYADRPDGTGKWARYDVEGRMVKGEDYRYGGWYRFDEVTGAMVKGWYSSEDGKKYYYSRENGHMAHGRTVIDGQEYYFDEVTGILADCVWVWTDEGVYWYEKGIRQGYDRDDPGYRGKEIYDPESDAWYWLDNVQNGAKAVSKDVYQESESGDWGDAEREDGTKIGKWVRYDAEGHMVKGWCAGAGADAEKIASPAEGGGRNVYYFDLCYGTMAKGRVTIDGQEYYFDEVTGIMR